MDEKNVKNQRRKPKQQRALKKYNAVLDACTQVLAQFGYEKATILELSLVSGVAVPTIYQYFPNKEAIFIAWYERTIETLLQQILVVARGLAGGRDLRSFIFMIIQAALSGAQGSGMSLRKLILDLPDLLLSHVITTTERQTAAMVQQLVEEYLHAPVPAVTQGRLKILVRALQGYMIQRSLQESVDHDTQFEANELSDLVVAYLGDLVPGHDA